MQENREEGQQMIESAEDLVTRQNAATAAFYGDRIRIGVGVGTCGLANGADKVLESVRNEVKKQGLDFVVRGTGCIGFCQVEPLVDVLVPGLPRVFYHHMSPEKSRELVQALAKGDFRPDWALMRLDQDRLLMEKERKLTGKLNGLAQVPMFEELPFFKSQQKVALRNCGFINPHDIDDYLATGGYSFLAKALTSMEPDEIIDWVEKSGLRGRGGGGFSTGRKWRSCRRAEGYPKYVL